MSSSSPSAPATKQPKAEAGAAAAAAAPPSFTAVAPRLDALPEAAHRGISAFCPSRDWEAVVLASRSLLAACGHLHSRAYIDWCPFSEAPGAPWARKGVRARWLARQRALTRLRLREPSLFPVVAEAMLRGAWPGLKELEVSLALHSHARESLRGFVTTLERAFAAAEPTGNGSAGALPGLEDLRIDFQWSDRGACLAFLQAFGAGAWPRLKRLQFPLEPEEAPWLADALEARRARGGCAGLASLRLAPEYDWLRTGPVETRKRIWRVLLPTVERVGVGGMAGLERADDRSKEEAIADAVIQHGAPRLEELAVHRAFMARCLHRLPGLRALSIGDGALQPTYPRLFAGAVAAAGGPRHFLPALRRLEAYMRTDTHGKRLFGPLGAGVFAGVASLRLTVGDPHAAATPAPRRAASELGRALAAGAFATLERLELKLALATADAGGDAADPPAVSVSAQLHDLLRGVVAGPCARTLRAVAVRGAWLHHHAANAGGGEGEGGEGEEEEGGWLGALGAAIAAGRLPALVALDLSNNRVDDEGVEALLAPFSAERPLALQELALDRTDVGDRGAAALAAALEEGRLGSRLRELRIGGPGHYSRITNAGASRLRDALVAAGARRRLPWLRLVEFNGMGVTREGMLAFVTAVRPCLPPGARLEMGGRHLRCEDYRWLEAAVKEGEGAGVWDGGDGRCAVVLGHPYYNYATQPRDW